VEVTLSKHRQDAIQQFMEAVRKIPQITDCYHITGRADFLLRVAVTDMAAYEDFLLHTLSALPALQHVETMIIMRTVKDGRQLPINHQPTKGDS
jgi:Lrp/AsnC family leucine-responsive transcriptional regulator